MKKKNGALKDALVKSIKAIGMEDDWILTAWLDVSSPLPRILMHFEQVADLESVNLNSTWRRFLKGSLELHQLLFQAHSPARCIAFLTRRFSDS